MTTWRIQLLKPYNPYSLGNKGTSRPASNGIYVSNGDPQLLLLVGSTFGRLLKRGNMNGFGG
jgi:hypothetical protein